MSKDYWARVLCLQTAARKEALEVRLIARAGGVNLSLFPLTLVIQRHSDGGPKLTF
jgi:hypothetical protein